MNLGPSKVFIPNPSAATVVQNTDIGATYWEIAGALPFFGASVSSCGILCASPCEEQIIDITFQDVDFGTCNECGKRVGFTIMLQRQSNFDIQDYLHLTSRLTLNFEPAEVPSGTTQSTAILLAEYFEDLINTPYDDEHDFFGITAVAANGVLTLTVPCPNKVDVYPTEGSVSSPTEKITINVTDPGAPAVLQRDQLLKEFPLMIGYVPGQGPDVTYTGCQDICVISLKGCIPDCPPDAEKLLHTENAVHLHTVGTDFTYELFVNSSAPGYLDFINQLNTAILPGGCQITIAAANTQLILAADDAGGTTHTELDLSPVMVGVVDTFDDAPVSGSISNGSITITWDASDSISTMADLVTYLNAAMGTPASFADSVTDNVLEVTDDGAFDNDGTYTITIN